MTAISQSVSSGLPQSRDGVEDRRPLLPDIRRPSGTDNNIENDNTSSCPDNDDLDNDDSCPDNDDPDNDDTFSGPNFNDPGDDDDPVGHVHDPGYDNNTPRNDDNRIEQKCVWRTVRLHQRIRELGAQLAQQQEEVVLHKDGPRVRCF
eukprot:CAMPEP_0177402422 /NCGR_PEP_ID=MMETSP0368-20130122/60210_1 /TAXON_ID=447022 ORGANISM="Scrippsiella hangoei-like, Strain SHHI-4" /NCGR_SAMPLE_ID=MMETSP0368 /ASSEMBLY_ACC=CAM_ASM_000363 /LENGTH=147 /DNA_ID=CAMNT_0018870139 /DNA_START=172 /DNA_END=616 /DNA_ORIENTATION=-